MRRNERERQRMRKNERERERERERQRQRQRQRETERQRQTENERETYLERETETDRERERQKERDIERGRDAEGSCDYERLITIQAWCHMRQALHTIVPLPYCQASSGPLLNAIYGDFTSIRGERQRRQPNNCPQYVIIKQRVWQSTDSTHHHWQQVDLQATQVHN